MGSCQNLIGSSIEFPKAPYLPPLMFMVFINHLPAAIEGARVHLYTDDTVLSVSGANTEELNHELFRVLEHVYHWMNRNQLNLNLKKTVNNVAVLLDPSYGPHKVITTSRVQ